MSTEPHAPIRGRYVEAMQAYAANPGGLRMQAYLSAMPMLVEFVVGLGAKGLRP